MFHYHGHDEEEKLYDFYFDKITFFKTDFCFISEFSIRFNSSLTGCKNIMNFYLLCFTLCFTQTPLLAASHLGILFEALVLNVSPQEFESLDVEAHSKHSIAAPEN
jgi:hypothetical protein